MDSESVPEPSPLFMKARAYAFSCITCVALLWIVLLCLEIFSEWETSDSYKRSFALVFLVVDTITAIMLPILILRPFRVWLDGARILLLMVMHFGLAITFIVWSSRIQCSHQSADAYGVCKLTNLYLELASWVIPILLIIYAAGLAYMVYRRPRSSIDLEKNTSQASITTSDTEDTLSIPQTAYVRDLGTTVFSLQSSQTPPTTATKSRFSTSTSRMSTKLPKRLPDSYYYS
ncbi:hypothetical protein HGRIS_013177 [Hohenbuehelia grisea]|uniref:MARVEL domain-containing protein n=1 Tax=Hohenbuehelia grisea TaxID=104357 RepID=A0ABR3IUN1_9AGAR